MDQGRPPSIGAAGDAMVLVVGRNRWSPRATARAVTPNTKNKKQKTKQDCSVFFAHAGLRFPTYRLVHNPVECVDSTARRHGKWMQSYTQNQNLSAIICPKFTRHQFTSMSDPTINILIHLLLNYQEQLHPALGEGVLKPKGIPITRDSHYLGFRATKSWIKKPEAPNSPIWYTHHIGTQLY